MDNELYQEVSSEGAESPETDDVTTVEDGYEGTDEAELEEVAGFDSALAVKLSPLAADVAISAQLQALPEAGFDQFPQIESVCDRDDRVQISPATQIPWRMNCQLIITRADGALSRCTGWFIGPRTVMTAGHCLYSHAAGGWARQIEVIPGMDGASRPFGSQIATSFRSVLGWTGNPNGNPDYDYGAIILPNNSLGNLVGWYGFAALSTASLTNLLVNNSGYPADKSFGTQWYNAGRITQVTVRRLFYMIDTFGGQSGSIIYRLSNGQRHAVGIHGYGGCPNKAVRITQPVFDNMLAWKQLGF